MTRWCDHSLTLILQSDVASTRSLAAVALLMGGGDQLQLEDRVRKAVARFCSVPFSALRAEHLASSHLPENERYELVGARKSAALSEVDAFVSHSWSDDGHAKCAAIIARTLHLLAYPAPSFRD